MPSLVEAVLLRRAEEQVRGQLDLAAGRCGCGAPLIESNKSGKCFKCYRASLKRTPAAPAPAPSPEPKEAPMPGPSSPLDKMTDAEVRAAYEKHGPSVNACALKLGVAWGTLKSRLASMGIGSAARRLSAQKPPRPAPAPREKPPEPPRPGKAKADGAEQPIEELLKGRLAHHRERVAELLHHQDEAAKLESALAAMLNQQQ